MSIQPDMISGIRSWTEIISEFNMTPNVTTRPKYTKEQIVCFVGGVGKIRSYQPNSSSWTYAVEMEMGPEPDMGRVGSETTVLLHEADIQGVMN